MKKFFMFLVSALFFVGCTSSQPKLSQMQVREITTKELQGDYKTVFKAAMSVLQDQEYIIENTDFNSGLIVCTKEVNPDMSAGDVMMVLFVDMRHSRAAKVKVSATINEINDKVTSIRLNVQEIKVESGSFGNKKENVVNIQNKEVYDQIFNQIRVEVERRK